jgi:type I restriction enzyme M protein
MVKNTKKEPIEKQLWKAADKLRKNIDAAEYKHIILGLIFLKYISDAFEELHKKLKSEFKEQLKEEERLNALILENLKKVVIKNEH